MQLVFILLLYLSTLLSLLISLTGFSMCKIISPESRVKLSPFFSNLNAQHLFLLPIVWARNLKHLLLSRCGEGKHPCLFLMAKAEPSPHPWCECLCWSLSYWLYQIGIRFFLLLVFWMWRVMFTHWSLHPKQARKAGLCRNDAGFCVFSSICFC